MADPLPERAFPEGCYTAVQHAEERSIRAAVEGVGENLKIDQALAVQDES